MAYEGGNGYPRLLEFDLTNDTISLGDGLALGHLQQPQRDADQLSISPCRTLFRTSDSHWTSTSASVSRASTRDQRRARPTNRLERRRAIDPPRRLRGSRPDLDGASGQQSFDFVQVEGALAHWRFNGHDGIVDADTVIEDIVGDNDLTRVDPADTAAVGGHLGGRHHREHGCARVLIERRQQPASTIRRVRLPACLKHDSRRSNQQRRSHPGLHHRDLRSRWCFDWDAAANGWSKVITRIGQPLPDGRPAHAGGTGRPRRRPPSASRTCASSSSRAFPPMPRRVTG